MAEPVKPEMVDLDEGGQQLITVQTPSDDQQLIMVTFSGSGATDVTQAPAHEHIYVGNIGQTAHHEGDTFIHTSNSTSVHENGTQTETVFGLEDLPTVTEIVRKTIAKTKKQEEKGEAVSYGPVNGIYTCAICARVYRNKMTWQNHLVSHNGDEVLMCGVCGQLFNKRTTLKAHLDIHVVEEKKMKRQRETMYRSVDMKVGGVYMPGDIIPKESDSNQIGIDGNISNDGHSDVGATEEVIVEDDETVVTGSNSNMAAESYIYACNICGKQYAVKEECEKHLSVHTGGGDEVATESTETSTVSQPKTPVTPTPSPKIQLENKKSPTDSQLKFSAYIYACNICGKQYTNKSNCKRHMRIHTEEEKSYECEYCGKRFAQKYEVKMHARIHTGEKPFSCAVCGKNFTERGNWRRHTQIHVRPTENSPYRCGICCKGFFHPEKLQVHLQIHSGQRPFICTVCGRKVKKIGDMYRHLRTHTGEKPYRCQVCGKGFAQNGNLKDHMKMHTGEKPHVCDLCGKDFARKVLLKDHIKHHHKGTTLQDLTEAALEEIERQEAEMEGIETGEVDNDHVVQEISAGNVPKILSSTSLGKTIVIGGSSNSAPDEADLLHEEQEIELQDVHATLTEKELEAAHVLTVVQDGDNMVYTYNVNTDGSATPVVLEENAKHEIVVSTEDVVKEIITTTVEPHIKIGSKTFATADLEVQNS